jgi:hypothetical protein
VPPQPEPPKPPSISSRLQNNLKVADVMLKHGTIDPAAYQKLQSDWQLLQKEGVIEAVQAAAAGDNVRAGELFNNAGSARNSLIADPRTKKEEIKYQPLGDPNSPMVTGYKYTLPDGTVIKPHEMLEAAMSYKDKLASIDKLAQTAAYGVAHKDAAEANRIGRENLQLNRSMAIDERAAARKDKEIKDTLESVFGRHDAELQSARDVATKAQAAYMTASASPLGASPALAKAVKDAGDRVKQLHDDLQRDVTATHQLASIPGVNAADAAAMVLAWKQGKNLKLVQVPKEHEQKAMRVMQSYMEQIKTPVTTPPDASVVPPATPATKTAAIPSTPIGQPLPGTPISEW